MEALAISHYIPSKERYPNNTRLCSLLHLIPTTTRKKKKEQNQSLGSYQILPSAPVAENEKRTEEHVQSLKDLIPFRYPAGTETPPFEHMPNSVKRSYVKVKEPLFDPMTSRRIYWREVPSAEDDHGHGHGCCFFLKRSIRRMINKWFGTLFGLPKFDEFSLLK
ncbi:unnamed protein product [Microthlaspi erraticum]|uniref:Uncharacterized protein n=1 Tax=Microthlaspi erraticum TaxID=1685480 RepID=A0A6D2JUM4_9BRAS|nr:unnamed protein product [Microthlaspi erraticum]